MFRTKYKIFLTVFLSTSKNFKKFNYYIMSKTSRQIRSIFRTVLWPEVSYLVRKLAEDQIRAEDTPEFKIIVFLVV